MVAPRITQGFDGGGGGSTKAWYDMLSPLPKAKKSVTPYKAPSVIGRPVSAKTTTKAGAKLDPGQAVEMNPGTPWHNTKPAPTQVKNGSIGGGGSVSVPRVTTPQAENASRLKAIEDMLRKSSDSFYSSQEAMLRQTRDEQIANLEKAYSSAVAEGKLSMEEAKRQFDEAVNQINELAYLDAQRTQLTAQDRGIQNSQQLLGLQAGDDARKNQLHQTVTSERDVRINTIKDRIAQITKEKDLDVTSAKNAYNTGLQGARAQADMMFTDKWSGIQHEQYVAERNHGWDLDKMQKSFEQDMAKMAQQHQYASAQQAQAHRNSMAQASARYKIEAQNNEAKYQQDLQRLRNQYTPGTPEYETAQLQLQAERSQRDAQLRQEAQIQADSALVSKGAPSKSNYQKDNWGWNWVTGSSFDSKAYNSATSAYQSALERLGLK